MGNVFDTLADSYDRWYDTAEGAGIFAAERDCLLSVYSGSFDCWLEVGVGTGRFASALGIRAGVDPSPKMLAIAARRGIETCGGAAERLPFADCTFGGALMALTLCFVADAALALRECYRVLRPQGLLLLGIVPAESAWGRAYKAKADAGHPVYRHALFRTADEIGTLTRGTGFVLRGAASTLHWKPDEEHERKPRILPSGSKQGGFMSMLFSKQP